MSVTEALQQVKSNLSSFRDSLLVSPDRSNSRASQWAPSLKNNSKQLWLQFSPQIRPVGDLSRYLTPLKETLPNTTAKPTSYDRVVEEETIYETSQLESMKRVVAEKDATITRLERQLRNRAYSPSRQIEFLKNNNEALFEQVMKLKKRNRLFKKSMRAASQVIIQLQSDVEQLTQKADRMNRENKELLREKKEMLKNYEKQLKVFGNLKEAIHKSAGRSSVPIDLSKENKKPTDMQALRARSNTMITMSRLNASVPNVLLKHNTHYLKKSLK